MAGRQIALWKTGRLVAVIASAAALLGGVASASADVLGIQNNAASGNGPIVTVDLTTNTIVNSFIPEQATICTGGGPCNGRGVEVLGDFVYYTELTNSFGPSTGIYVAPPSTTGRAARTSRAFLILCRARVSSISPPPVASSTL